MLALHKELILFLFLSDIFSLVHYPNIFVSHISHAKVIKLNNNVIILLEAYVIKFFHTHFLSKNKGTMSFA